ncbi:MAG: carboxylating nicotinate-nucleotide diphosphorylase [Dehalococcoidia bacterium]|nr:carboxylating nicotinate-nucleotide diphosphorylase [Dehalococcoidia bacterium]
MDERTHALDPALVRDIVAAALAEDRAAFDVTTQATVPPDQQGQATFLYKADGVVCGLDLAREVFAQCSPDLVLTVRHPDGTWVESGAVAAEVEGPLAAMLSGERVALNLVQRLSGIATMARRYVDEAAKGGPARIVDTRKTTPGLRALERYAVRTGGARNHRNTLEDGVLIKDNHLAAAAARGIGLAEVVRLAREHAAHTLRIEVEVTEAEQAREAIEASADVILLDNMPPEQMRDIVAAAPPHVLFEASGGITLDTLAEVAATGVHLISAGALTHSAPALDISIEVDAAATSAGPSGSTGQQE